MYMYQQKAPWPRDPLLAPTHVFKNTFIKKLQLSCIKHVQKNTQTHIKNKETDPSNRIAKMSLRIKLTKSTCYTCYTCGHTLKCSLGVKRPSHRNPMYFPEVSVDGVFESVHSSRCYNMLRESIPSIDYSLAEIVMSDVYS